MSSEVFYRKWRPRSFAELAGQEAVVRTLTNAVGSGKVAHAYLFSGPRGTGKTTSGRLLAKAVNCAQPKSGEPCNACPSCQNYLEGRALDLIELDAASNRGIDEIRSLREKAAFAPAGGVDAYKVYLVDEVHMLTEPAFNALLKTLEEPPPHVIFVLATTEAHKVPATVASRCQRFDFRRIPLAAVVGRLAHIAKEEGITLERDALEAIARAATGSLRDAINLLEQLVDSYGPTLTLDQVREGLGFVFDARSAELAALALRSELGAGLALISSVRDDGLDLRQFQRQVVLQLRGLLLAKAGAPPGEGWSEEQVAEMRAVVAAVPAGRVVATLRAFGEADLRADPLSPLPLELALATSVLEETAASAPSVATRPAAPAPPVAARPATPAPRPPAPRTAKAPAPEGRAANGSDQRPTETARPAASAPPAQGANEQPAPVPAQGANEQPAPVPAQASTNQPAPVPAQASTSQPAHVPAGDGSLLDEARARWPEIYKRAREIDFQTGALLNSGCGIIQAASDEIVFGFRLALMLNKMQENGGKNLRALQQAVDEVVGEGRRVRCVLDPNVDVQRPPRGGHLVRAAEELSGELGAEDA